MLSLFTAVEHKTCKKAADVTLDVAGEVNEIPTQHVDPNRIYLSMSCGWRIGAGVRKDLQFYLAMQTET